MGHPASWIWVLIPLAAIISGIFRHWFRLKEKQIEALKHQAADSAAVHAAQTERLEQRVRVLERIATDRGIDVAEEIERLRDRPTA
ncbi:hypothetical protein GCM10023232_06480 [Sphingosinicella ginsenosidimutans]|jgi:hypothetical protein|uniref:Envelope stress response membrane protein PspB n=1 Tax=Allosphingosinicella ginsenosidimutans TaxID=1176539 RepID=A0A5C6TXI7_9SPHN|nr:hypothetical protein [Sphingosinicella ginsenosidimutans]TXC64488.1 hypothetical protein FRZ32_12990 [Sphingosinicella ginsenosidimutans]